METVIPPPVGFQNRSNQADSALSEDIEEDVQGIDSLDQDLEAENVKGWEKLLESTFSNTSIARDLPQQTQAWGVTMGRRESEVHNKPYCPRCRVDSHSEAECVASLLGKLITRGKTLTLRTVSRVSQLGRGKTLKSLSMTLLRSWLRGGILMIFSTLWKSMIIRTSLRAICCLFLVTLLRVTAPRVIAWQEMQK